MHGGRKSPVEMHPDFGMVDVSDDSEVLSDDSFGWEFVNHPS